ncbi:hypothetical protein FGADI_5424 [Fusarium gaditjirri]|uniref:Uncharacterized protein n=1 Tax=Fusarium gaditjirri TaxID=282569 RepID=A0A8H4WYB1_9HYPO|nr:hypothetical protein FGADI_5424 [Fusarium gaditjirri]
MPPKKSGKPRKRPQAETSRSPSPVRPAKKPKPTASPPLNPEEKKTRKSNKPDQGCPGWWPPEYAPTGKPLPANKAGMRKVIKAFQDADRDPAELWTEGGLMLQLVNRDPVGRIHQRIFNGIDFENLVLKTPSQREEVPGTEDEQALLDDEDADATPEPLAESAAIAKTPVPRVTEAAAGQTQNADTVKPASDTIKALRDGDALDSHDMVRCVNLLPRPKDWYIFPPGSSFTDADRIRTQHPALRARHIAFFVHNQTKKHWALCHLDLAKATLAHYPTNSFTRVPAEELVDWLRSQRKMNMSGMMFEKKNSTIHLDSLSTGIFALVSLKSLMAKKKISLNVDFGAARMEFIKMIGSAETDESAAIEDSISVINAGVNGDTTPTGLPQDQAIPIDPQLETLSSKSNPAQTSIHAEQNLVSRPTPETSEQPVLISSSENSPEPMDDEPESGGEIDDEAANTESADTAPTDNAIDPATKPSPSNPPTNPDDPITIAQSLEANFAAFLDQRRKLEACVQAEQANTKKNDEMIAELQQARQGLVRQRSSTTEELKRKVAELERQLGEAKGELEAAEGAETEFDMRVKEFGDKIRGEETSKMQSVEKIKQWEATLAKTAL